MSKKILEEQNSKKCEKLMLKIWMPKILEKINEKNIVTLQWESLGI